MGTELDSYVEDVALYWEEMGLPRIAGRILCVLLVCEPPHRSGPQLADELGVSKGSISTMMRMLLASGIIEKVGVPGERATYYAVRSDGFERRFEVMNQSFVTFRKLMDRGLALLESQGASEERMQRLRDLSAMYAFWEREIPALLAKWRAERDKQRAEAEDKDE